MPLEIDMLSVKDADAIVIRTTDGTGEHVILIDAGNNCDAHTIVNQLSQFTSRKNKVDLLISTHPHNDHIGGLPEILDRLCVDEVFIHEPDSYRATIESNKAYFHSERLYEAQKSLACLTDVIAKIDSEKIPRSQPFAGLTDKVTMLDGAELTILGPTEPFYEQQVQAMKSLDSVHESTSDCAILDAEDDQSPFNNSSVICLLTHGGLKYLFTADAGPAALEGAKKYARGSMANVHWMQIPHHGSKYNITCELIEYFASDIAYVSAAGSHDNRPNAAVVRSFKDFRGKDCGSKVYGTNKSENLWKHTTDAAARPSTYSTLTESDELDRDGK